MLEACPAPARPFRDPQLRRAVCLVAAVFPPSRSPQPCLRAERRGTAPLPSWPFALSPQQFCIMPAHVLVVWAASLQRVPAGCPHSMNRACLHASAGPVLSVVHGAAMHLRNLKPTPHAPFERPARVLTPRCRHLALAMRIQQATHVSHRELTKCTVAQLRDLSRTVHVLFHDHALIGKLLMVVFATRPAERTEAIINSDSTTISSATCWYRQHHRLKVSRGMEQGPQTFASICCKRGRVPTKSRPQTASGTATAKVPAPAAGQTCCAPDGTRRRTAQAMPGLSRGGHISASLASGVPPTALTHSLTHAQRKAPIRLRCRRSPRSTRARAAAAAQTLSAPTQGARWGWRSPLRTWASRTSCAPPAARSRRSPS